MATWSVMTDVPNPLFDLNGDPFSGAVLKAYLPGTTTSTSIAIDSSGSSPQASMTANAEGKWEVSGNEVLPYIDRKHKWGVFANATDAAANTPFYMGSFDNVEKQVDKATTGVDSGNITYNQGGSGAEDRTQESKNQETPTFKDYGAVGDGATDDFTDISEFNADLSGAVVISDPYLIGTTIDLSGLELVFRKGGSLVAGAGATITIGNMSGPREQLFSGSGTFTFNTKTDVFFPEWFGVTTAASDQSVNMQTAIDAASEAKAALDGGGSEYRLDLATLHKANVWLKDMDFDISNAAAITAITPSGGSLGSSLTVSSDISVGDTVLNIADTSTLSADDYIRVSSDNDWSIGASVKLSEWARIKSVDTATAFTVFGKIEMGYTTAQNAKVQKVTLVEGVKTTNVKITGNNTDLQTGFDYEFCLEPVLLDLEGNKLASRFLQLDNCVNPRFSRITHREASGAGLAYGVAIIGCLDVQGDTIHGEDVRHVVSFGGTNGINQGGQITNVTGYGLRAAIVDAHAGARDIIFDGATSNNPNHETNEDGFTAQCVNITAKNIRLSGGANRHGFLVQPDVDFNGGRQTYIDISGSTEEDGQIGFFLETAGTLRLDFLKTDITISNPGTFGASVEADDGDIGLIDLNLNIDEVDEALSEAVRLRNVDPSQILGGKMSINSRRDNDSDDNILLLGTATNNIQNLSINGFLENGLYGVRGSNVATGTINTAGVVFAGMLTGDTIGL